MLSEQRYEAIMNRLKTQNFVKVSELTEEFGVSIETVRRDLFFLESKGLLKRIHGGAARVEKIHEFQDLHQRVHCQSEQKKQLAKLAASLIQEKDIIAIDYGSTAIQLAEAIKAQFHSLTVVTNSAAVFQILRDLPDFQLLLIGGQYYRKEDAFYGPLAENQLRNVSVSKSFVFPSGISMQAGVTDYIAEFIAMQKAYLQIARQAVILADSSKFEDSTLFKICDISSKEIYLTDSDFSDELYERYLKNSINVFRSEKLDHA